MRRPIRCGQIIFLLFYNNGDSGLLLTSSYSRYLIGGHLYMSAALLFHWNKIMLISIARISFAVSEAFHQKLLSVLICWARFDVCWTYLCGMKMCLFSICAHYWFCSACCLLGGFVFCVRTNLWALEHSKTRLCFSAYCSGSFLWPLMMDWG